MEFEPVSLAAERMGVNVRTIQKWAKDGKISGAKKVGRDWMIPISDISHGNPDLTGIVGKPDLFLKLFITNWDYVPGECLESINKLSDENERNIALGEYYYYRGEMEKASEILEPYMNSSHPALRSTSALICSFANLCIKHSHMTSFALSILEKQIEDGFKAEVGMEGDSLGMLMLAIVSIQFHYNYDDIPPLQDYVRYLPDGLKMYACYLMAYKAYFEKDYSRSLGIVNTAICCSREIYPISMIYLHIMASIDLMNLTRIEEAKQRIEKAWELAEKDGILVPFAEHYGLLQGAVEAFFKKKHPEVYQEIIALTKKYNTGWYKHHNEKTGRTVADNLTTTEFTIAMLYNRGWKIKEIANHIELSERTVKNYLQIVYEKIGINGKKELEKYMLK